MLLIDPKVEDAACQKLILKFNSIQFTTVTMKNKNLFSNDLHTSECAKEAVSLGYTQVISAKAEQEEQVL